MAQAKLAAAISSLSRKGNNVAFYLFKDRIVRNPVLSLQALGAGSRLRLLVRALEHLHTQAGTGLTRPLFSVLSKSSSNKLHANRLLTCDYCVSSECTSE